MNLPLCAIKKTILALNKDIVFPDIIVMRMLWGPANKFAYFSTSGVDPSAGNPTAIVATATVAPAPVVTCGTCVYNLTLFLATEKNEDLAQTVRALVNSPAGLNLLIDYPYSYRQNIIGQSNSISLRFNRGHGKNLMSVISSPFSTVESINSAYDCFNVANSSIALQSAVGAKMLNYYSQLDNVRLQDITLVCGNAQQDDYRENRKFMKNTPYVSSEVYNNNWFHQDKFYEENLIDENLPENMDKGMSLIVERKYDFLATMTNASVPVGAGYNWYTFALVQKDLHIGANMIQYQ
jgi:hypothetical protein